MRTITDQAIKCLLKDARSAGPTPIYLVYRYEYTRFKVSTGQSIAPDLWDTTNGRARTDVKNRAVLRDNETINAHLDRQRSALRTVLNRLQLAGVPITNDLIKQYFDKEVGRKEKKVAVQDAKESFTAYIVRFVEEAKAGKRLNAKEAKYAPYTLAGYMKLKRILENYQAATGNPIDYDAYTLAYYDAFKLWLTNRGLTLNYVGTLLKDLKVMLKQSHHDGMHENTIYQHPKFKKLVEDVDNVYLTDDELTALFTLNLSANARLDRVRDLFLIGAYTGLRFSDFSDLRPENITHNGRILTRKALKTNGRVSIPLNPNVLSILAKYDGVPPRTITNQKMNDYIKELCRLAGIVEKVEVSRTVGGSRQTRYLDKCELVTTHTARRSFATNAYLAGVPTVAIMKCTGHKSETVFLRYIKISPEQNALLLLNHPHFGGIHDTQNSQIIPMNKVA
ncbi:integrase family protein [Fibrisoma limi BUZ 3]|uniref:Integrase family protein n=1 Tax=Fibrisoma limi BUZ 3 TaxID=1185876 RepID=I2GPQ9_9BACT|nr:site-specific integrase [Fibrisoma limi]CCH55887.1 integrase family protein [Fibrisoma limi BUZ 3]